MVFANKELSQVTNAVRELQAKRNFLSIAVYRLEGDYAVRIAAEGATCSQCERVHVSSGNIGAVARTGKPYVCKDVTADPQYKSCFRSVKAETVMPVKVGGKTVAVVDVEADNDNIDFDEISVFSESLLPFFQEKRTGKKRP